MVTLLWERHFTHIRYQVAEDFIQETVTPTRPQESFAIGSLLEKEKTQRRAIADSAQSALVEFLGPKLGDQVAQIFVLSEEEIASIKQLMKKEENINPITILTGILALILRIEKDDKAFLEMVDIFDDVLETLMLRGDFRHSIKILELFRELIDPKRNLPESQRHRLIQAIGKAGEPLRMRDLEPLMNQWGAVDTDQMFSFLILLNKNAVVPLTDLLGRLTQMKMRRVICEALVQLAKDDIEPLARKLDDSRWFVVRNIVYILGRIGQEKVIEKFQKLVDHKEVKVRKELITTLDGMKNPKAHELLKWFLNDPENSLRILAMRSLAKQKYQGALPLLEDMIESPEFMSKDFYEKKEIFEALGRIGSEKVVPKMRKFVKKGGSAWFKKALNEELGLCAVVALQRIGTEGAVAVLKEGQGLSSRIIREACKKALGELEKSREKLDG